jgi:hypothetical protein
VNDATYPGLAMTTIGNTGIFDPGRNAARAAVNAHATNINGATSIGAGVQLARNTLSPVAGFQDKALLVFTDGQENTAPMIADVLGDIDNRTFAIGLGNAQQVSTSALTALTNGTGGYLLLTGLLSASTEDYFLLSKYFLQILAGVTNTDIVTDPTGFLTHGSAVQIPFVLTEADIESTVLLLTDIPAIDLAVRTPAGTLITPANAPGFGVNYSDAGTTRYYRYTLPVAIGGGAAAGTWEAVLKFNDVEFRRYCQESTQPGGIPGKSPCARNGVRYSLSAMAWSNLRMKATLAQSSMQPGATLTLRASLTEYEVPVEDRAGVVAQVTRPDGSTVMMNLADTGGGVFEASLTAVLSGVYRFHVIASGTTLRGVPFTREQLLTGAVFPGGDDPLPHGTQPGSQSLCCMLGCLLKEKSVTDFLERQKLNAEAIRKCVQECCRKRQ